MPESPSRGAVLISGASTGIGRACTEHLDGLGFTVFAGVRKQSDADSLRDAGSGRTQPVMLDVTDSESITSALRTVDEACPGGLTGLVNNAGISVAVLSCMDARVIPSRILGRKANREHDVDRRASG